MSKKSLKSQNNCICICSSVGRDAIESSIKEGSHTVEAICKATGAAEVCGACIPKIEQVISDPRARIADASQSFIMLALAMLSIMPLLAFFTTHPVNIQSVIDQPWWYASTPFMKQVSGGTLVFIMLLMMTLTLKRIYPQKVPFSFHSHRMRHIILGAILPLILLVHTGAHRGENFNALLLTIFISSLITGILATFITALGFYLPRNIFIETKKWLLRLHLVALALLPLFLLIHIVRVYLF